MTKTTKATEYDLLRLFVLEMEEKGVTRNTIHLDVDEAAVDLMRKKLKVIATLEEIHRLADKCLAHEWLQHVFMGAGQYGSLSLTISGHGVVRSLQAKEVAKAKRSTLKRVSDYIEDHKGLFVVIGVLIALAGVITKLGK
jgi:hypothetical protein